MKSPLLLTKMGLFIGFTAVGNLAKAQSAPTQRAAPTVDSRSATEAQAPPATAASAPVNTASSSASTIPSTSSVEGQNPVPNAPPTPLPLSVTPTAEQKPATDAAVVQEATTEQHTTVTPPTGSAEPPGAKPLKIGGGAILWYYQPTKGSQKNNLEFFNVRLNIDADFGDHFGFHAEPRFRDTKLRSYYDGTVWLQEAYASFTNGKHTFKLGKAYSRLGLFWDNSFWGNVQVYDGLKLAPDYGASVEGAFDVAGPFALGYAAQFFLVDGRTNVSIAGRDTISIPDSKRRNEVVLRLDPTLQYASNGTLRVGLSTQYLKADSPGIPSDQRQVWRYALDIQLTHGGLGVWGEYLRQDGQTVTDYPIAGIAATATTPAVPGRASHHIDYYLAGGEYALWRVTLRYNISAANYHGVDVTEWMHVPAVAFKINDHLQLSAEYVHWLRSVSGAHEPYNRSLNGLLFVNL